MKTFDNSGVSLFLNSIYGSRVWALGIALDLASFSPGLMGLSLRQFVDVVFFAIIQKRFALWETPDGVKKGFVVWAYLEEDVINRVGTLGIAADIHKSEWNAGTGLCFLCLTVRPTDYVPTLRGLLKYHTALGSTVTDLVQHHALQSTQLYDCERKSWRKFPLREVSKSNSRAAQNVRTVFARQTELDRFHMLGAASILAGAIPELRDVEIAEFREALVDAIDENRARLFFGVDGIPVGFAADEVDFNTGIPERRVAICAQQGHFFSIALQIRAEMRTKGMSVRFHRHHSTQR